MELPIANGRPLLLVPRDWARGTLLVNSGRYYDKAVLDFAQLEQSMRLKNGKIAKPRKDDLRDQEGLGRGLDTILNVTKRAHQGGFNLVKEFKSFVDDRYEPLDDDEIARKLG
jgi:hypothetical protein